MADLGNERGNPLGTKNLVALHRGIKDRNKNAGFRADTRQDLQQLQGDYHG